MKIAILGAGFSGLTAAYELQKRGHEVWLFEKNSAPGGAAGGFKRPSWSWYLDYTYHHWFVNDHHIFRLCREIGWNKILVRRPETATLYTLLYKSNKLPNPKSKQTQNNNQLFKQLFGKQTQIYKLDSPLDLMRFDRLNLFERLRTGLVLAALKYGPKFSIYDKLTSERFLTTAMGDKSFKTLWHPLFAKKFAKYANRINAAFFWARIKKRTTRLAYPEGGYQALANYFVRLLQQRGVKIIYNFEVLELRKNPNSNSSFSLTGTLPQSTLPLSRAPFEAVINTLPSPIFLKLEKGILPHNYRKRLARIEYLGAQTVIFETPSPVLPRTYWLNIADMANPWMVAVQHTNFIDHKHFNKHHLLYLATYTNNPKQTPSLPQALWQKSIFIPYAQPVYTTDFPALMPDYKPPVTNLYFANIELTYPYDRGTNYAVKVGKQVIKYMSI